jgi:hypothetical protein
MSHKHHSRIRTLLFVAQPCSHLILCSPFCVVFVKKKYTLTVKNLICPETGDTKLCAPDFWYSPTRFSKKLVLPCKLMISIQSKGLVELKCLGQPNATSNRSATNSATEVLGQAGSTGNWPDLGHTTEHASMLCQCKAFQDNIGFGGHLGIPETHMRAALSH